MFWCIVQQGYQGYVRSNIVSNNCGDVFDQEERVGFENGFRVCEGEKIGCMPEFWVCQAVGEIRESAVFGENEGRREAKRKSKRRNKKKGVWDRIKIKYYKVKTQSQQKVLNLKHKRLRKNSNFKWQIPTKI